MTENYRNVHTARERGSAMRATGPAAWPFRKDKSCTYCFPQGSGKCQNCRGLGGFDSQGQPVASEIPKP